MKTEPVSIRMLMMPLIRPRAMKALVLAAIAIETGDRSRRPRGWSAILDISGSPDV
jgi:hypothetical protein